MICAIRTLLLSGHAQSTLLVNAETNPSWFKGAK